VAGAGEWAVKNARVMQIHDRFGAGGSLTEDHAPGFNAAVVPRGHDGPDHRAIARGRIKVRPRRADQR
jgi:L-arabinose isomerase